MLGRDQQSRLGIEAALAVEQCLEPGTCAIGFDTADDGGSLQSRVVQLGDTAGNDHCLGPHVDRLTGFGDRRVRTKRCNGFALGGDQH